jgi:hypothetical protein
MIALDGNAIAGDPGVDLGRDMRVRVLRHVGIAGV